MAITEAISMYQELDLLEAHLEESQHWADRIVIIESPITFTGVEKPLYFHENRERFSRFNVDYLVTPPEEIELIPFDFPASEADHWFSVRQRNRNHNRQFHWDELRRGTDYVYLNDVDEFISRDKFHYLKKHLDSKKLHYLSIKTQRFNFWVNAKGSKQGQYRITRADKPQFHVVNRRKVPRKEVPEMLGWHFTNCFSTLEEHREKILGICCHMSCPVARVPTVEVIEERLSRLIEPFRKTDLRPGIREIMSREDRSWAPEFIQNFPDLFPWLNDTALE